MIGTIRWNIVFGLTAMVFTFLVSVSHNVLWTSFTGSVYSFVIAFIIGFFFRWVLGTVVGMKDFHLDDRSDSEDPSLDLGNNLDMRTPDEEEALQLILKEHLTAQNDKDNEFLPLNPPKLLSRDQPNNNGAENSVGPKKIDPEDLAKVLRHLSEE